MNETYKNIMTELGVSLGLEEIDVQDDCSLISFDDIEVFFNYTPETDQFILNTTLDFLPEAEREKLCLELLGANAFFNSTKGFTLAVLPDMEVSLHYSIYASVLKPGDIVTLTENFVNVAEHWQKYVRESAASSEQKGSADTADLLPV